MDRKRLLVPVLGLIFFIGLGCFTLAGGNPEDAEQSKVGYILISSKDLPHVNGLLRKSIKTIFPDAKETYLEYDCEEAGRYIKELNIKFVPFVIYDNSITATDRFFHMVRHNMVERVKGSYVIPSGQLKLGEIMLLGSEKTILQPVPIEFFYSDSCRPCQKVKEEFLPQIKSEFKDKIVITYHNISEVEELKLQMALEEAFGISKGAIPEIFLPTVALTGASAIRNNLAGAIEKLLEQRGGVPAKKDVSRKSPILNKFFTFSPAVVTFAGLADGINPCAFATMIFFVSFLALNSYNKRQITYIGSAFITGVFLTYLALGLGIFQVLKKLQIFSVFSQLIYYAIALLALGLGIYSLCDYIRYKRTGQTKGCGLKLYSRLRALADNGRALIILIVVAFVNGFIIALLESACTGQVYFPTIAFVLKVPGLRIHAFSYLVLYNLAFILPLVAVFLLARKGVASEKFAQFEQRHLGRIKLAYTLVFFSLAALLFVL